MSISGVGSSGSYIYNMQTERITAEAGKQEDEFVPYFNGDIEGKDSTSLNGYDQRTKGVIKNAVDRMQEFYEAGLMDRPLAEEGASEITVSYEIEDTESTAIYVNGEKRITAVAAIYYLPDEIKSFATVAPPFKTRVHQDYNPADNSIHIAVGDKFSYGNGYEFTVGENKVMGAGYDGKSDEENIKADTFLGALDSLIHFGDQQYFSSMIEKELTPLVLNFLREQGVDTSREFIVNETRCEVRNGRIYEVGNKTGVPNSIYNKALARYEESLAMPLAGIYSHLSS